MQLPDDIVDLVQSRDRAGDEKFVRALKAAQQKRIDEIVRLKAENAAIEAILSGRHPVERTDRTETVIRIIRDNGGSAQIDEILSAMRKVSGQEGLTKEALYHLLIGGKNSLVNRDKLTRTKSGREVIYSIGPKADIDVDHEPYLSNIQLLTDTSKHPEIAIRVAKGIAHYTEKFLWPRNNGVRVQPTRIYEWFRREGLIGSLENEIRSQESATYFAMLAIGYPEGLTENIVCDFPDAFAPDVVSRARQRVGR